MRRLFVADLKPCLIACELALFRMHTRQEWSSTRMQQIKDVVAWELDRLSQDLHE